jgi:hypothetical protein
VTFTGYVRWASFQIAYDPGKEIALVGGHPGHRPE